MTFQHQTWGISVITTLHTTTQKYQLVPRRYHAASTKQYIEGITKHLSTKYVVDTCLQNTLVKGKEQACTNYFSQPGRHFLFCRTPPLASAEAVTISTTGPRPSIRRTSDRARPELQPPKLLSATTFTYGASPPSAPAPPQRRL